MDRNRPVGSTTPIGNTGAAAVRVTALVVAAELARITPRDRYLLDLLDRHHTLTTDQIADIAFTSLGRARNRLADLHRRGVLDRFRHYQRPGSQSWRWTLGPLGAAIVAAGRGEPLPRPAAVRDATARLAMSPTLGHLLAVNAFFVALIAHARTHPEVRLARWWNEGRCREACANLVRPDGHGLWEASGRRVPFWLEADLGSEPLRRVAGKLTGYAHLGPRLAYPVLFWLPTAVRETNLHHQLCRGGIPDGLSVVTATAEQAAMCGGPAGRVWLRYGYGERITLVDLRVPTVDGESWGG